MYPSLWAEPVYLKYSGHLKTTAVFLFFSAVVNFNDVYVKSLCQPRDVLVDIFQEYPEDTEHIYIPSCVVLKRCGGYCNDEAMECVPTESQNVMLQVSPAKTFVFFCSLSGLCSSPGPHLEDLEA